jgi:hypothetical protein
VKNLYRFMLIKSIINGMDSPEYQLNCSLHNMVSVTAFPRVTKT